MTKLELALRRLIDLTDSLPQVSEEDVAEFEQEIGTPLPADFRTFLLARNGGRLQYHNSIGDHTIKSLYGLEAATDGSHSYSGLREGVRTFEGRMAEGFLAIGASMGDDTFCLCLQPGGYGQVHVWDRSEELFSPWIKMCHRVADSFTDFLAGLRPYEYDLEDLQAEADQLAEPFRSIMLWNESGLDVYLTNGGDPNVRNEELETPLMFAVRRGAYFAKRLLAVGATVALQDEAGQTALHHAIRFSSIDGTRLLLAKGADATIEDHRGRSPIYLGSDNARIVQLMKQFAPGTENIDFERLAGDLKRQELAQTLEINYLHEPVRELQVAFQDTVGFPLGDTGLLLLSFRCSFDDVVDARDTPLSELLDLMPRVQHSLHGRPVEKAKFEICRSLLSLAAARIAPQGREITIGQLAGCAQALCERVAEASHTCKSRVDVLAIWSAERRAVLEEDLHRELERIVANAKTPSVDENPPEVALDIRDQPLLFREQGAGLPIADSGFQLSIWPHKSVVYHEDNSIVENPELHLLAMLFPCVYYLPEGQEPPVWYEKLKEEVPHARYEICSSIFSEAASQIAVTKPDVTIGQIAEAAENLYEAVCEASRETVDEEDVVTAVTQATRDDLRRTLLEYLHRTCSLENNWDIRPSC